MSPEVVEKENPLAQAHFQRDKTLHCFPQQENERYVLEVLRLAEKELVCYRNRSKNELTSNWAGCCALLILAILMNSRGFAAAALR